MKTYSSTLIKLFNNNCPAALGFYESQTAYDRDFFNAGIAAHAILQQVGDKGAPTDPDAIKAVANAVVEELITNGRSYNGIHEPPMSPESALNGRDVALEYLLNNGLPEGAQYEIGLGMTIHGSPCAYDDPACRYRGILDLQWTGVVGDDDFAMDTLFVRDWKSAWPTNADELETIQRKGQAVLAYLHCSESIQAIQLEVTNIRTGATFDKQIVLDQTGIELLDLWKRDILAICNAMDKTREARPGAGCLDCHYVMSCPSCLEYARTPGADMAVSLATLEAMRDQYIAILKPKCKEHKIAIDNGFVGFVSKEKRTPNKTAHQALVEHWYSDDTETHTAEQSLIMACKLGVAQIEAAGKVLYDKNDAGFNDLMEAALTTKTESRFGVYKHG